MKHHKARKFVVLILGAVLLLSGCKPNVSFIIPPESTGDTVLIPKENTALISEDQPTSAATTAPTEPSSVPTEPVTEPVTEPMTEPVTEPVTEPETTPTVPEQTQPQSAAHKHRYTQSVVKPTCTERGYTKFTCSCGDSYTDHTTSALGHDYKVTTVAPTTSRQGYDLHQCRRCSHSYKDNYTDRLPSDSTEPDPTQHKHSYTKTVVKPTCTEKGYTRHTCSCGDSYKDNYTAALGHDYKVTTVAPTTYRRGYDLHQCRRCEHYYKDNYTDMIPEETTPPVTEPPETQPKPTQHKHSYTKSVVKPTCTEKGYTLYTCTCGDSYRSNYTDPLGHDYKVTVVQPTVEERGYNLHTCKRCGHSYKDNYVDKLPPHTEPPATEPPATEPPKYDHPVYDISNHVVGSLEYEILAEINARRAAEGLGELKMDKKLCALATIRAYESSISFSHTRPNGTSCFTVLTEYNYKGGSLAGENLLHASPGYPADKLVDVWMKSTSHKNNILTSSFTKAGLGIFYANGRMYIANFFAG